jgi:ribonuclease III
VTVNGSRLVELSARLGYTFNDPLLLKRAMAHRSWCAETPGEKSNERLEFLGDAVLGWVVADLAYRCQDEFAEGKLTDLRKALVNAAALADVAESVDLGCCLLLGRGEDAAGGRAKPSILSDALEAVIGAVYVEGGSEAAYDLIVRLLGDRVAGSGSPDAHLDYKTTLQELTARLFDSAPSYILREEGPDHAKRFFATVVVGGEAMGEGEGRSKKQAEQVAARSACQRIAARTSSDAAVGAGPAD